ARAAGRGRPPAPTGGPPRHATPRPPPPPPLRCGPDVHLSPLKSLEGGFGQTGNHKQAHLAYLEARHAVEQIVERHGQAGVRAVLAAGSRGAPVAAAFERVLGEGYTTFAAAFDAESRR